MLIFEFYFVTFFNILFTFDVTDDNENILSLICGLKFFVWSHPIIIFPL